MRLFFSLAAALAFAAFQATADETPKFVKSEHVSAKVINNGGHEFVVEGLGRVTISKVVTRKKDGRTCNVHLPSVARQLMKAEAALGITIKVKLKFVVYGEDDWGCRGAGNDCIADVVVEAL